MTEAKRTGMKSLALSAFLALLFCPLQSIQGSEYRHSESQAQVSGQESAPIKPADQTLRVVTSVVNFLFTVRDEKGNLVKDLTREDIQVFDNGSPQQLTHFTQADEALAMVVVMDKSASVKQFFDFQRRTTLNFLTSLLRPGKDQAMLVVFDRDPSIAVNLTDQVKDFKTAMTGLQAEGGTALFDAARFALDQYLNENSFLRNVLLLVTDGEDTVSWTTQKELSALALARNVVVFSLGAEPESGGNPKRSRKDLHRLAEDTGGRAFFPKTDSKELTQLFQQLEEELRFQFSIGYPLPPFDGKRFHEVKIVPRNKKYQIRTRRGYFMPAPDDAGAVAGGR